MMLELQLALVLLTLARGLLDFIWGIRQLNYCIAAVGAVPDPMPAAEEKSYSEIVARMLNPALAAFNAGIRGYYFALAAATWLFGPIPFIGATVGAIGLLLWRQRSSAAAGAIRDLRDRLENR
jgi:uncharacterized membrane protein